MVDRGFFFLATCGVQAGSNERKASSLTAEQARGKLLFLQRCSKLPFDPPARSHSRSLGEWLGSRADERVVGMTVAAYLEQSIRRPAEYVVDGFENLMPADTASALDQRDVDVLVVYLLALQ